MNDDALLETFDRQVRRSHAAPAGFSVALVEHPAPVLLLTPVDAGTAWGGGVLWSDLDESSADAAIAGAVDWFRPRGREFEWKHYGYDRPADLPHRLRAAGFEPDEEEALVVGEVELVRDRLAGRSAPAGVAFRPLRTDAAGAASDWQGVNDLHLAVWGSDATEKHRALAAEIEAEPAATTMWLAVADDGTVVCAARVNFHDGTDFASLWGGSTLPEWRGRGIYTELVSRRADEASRRGFRYLQVDASADSRPILARLGLRTLTVTTPWIWSP